MRERMTKAMLSDGGFETIIEWGIEIIMSQDCLLSSGQQSLGFSFLLGSRIIDLPMWLPNNEKRSRWLSGSCQKFKVLQVRWDLNF